MFSVIRSDSPTLLSRSSQGKQILFSCCQNKDQRNGRVNRHSWCRRELNTEPGNQSSRICSVCLCHSMQHEIRKSSTQRSNVLRLPGLLSPEISSSRTRPSFLRWPNMLIVVDGDRVIYSLTSAAAIVLLMPR